MHDSETTTTTLDIPRLEPTAISTTPNWGKPWARCQSVGASLARDRFWWRWKWWQAEQTEKIWFALFAFVSHFHHFCFCLMMMILAVLWFVPEVSLANLVLKLRSSSSLPLSSLMFLVKVGFAACGEWTARMGDRASADRLWQLFLLDGGRTTWLKQHDVPNNSTTHSVA